MLVNVGILAGGFGTRFADRVRLDGDLTVDLATGTVEHHNGVAPDWTVHLVDTGLHTGTGGRVRRLAERLAPDGTFLLTWGDGLSDVDLDALVAFHRAHGRRCTMTAVRPPARFGRLSLDGDRVTRFEEKPADGEGWVNGAFFVVEPEVADYVDDDTTMFEQEPLRRLAEDGELMAYRHDGFWQCMDTAHDHAVLERLWAAGAPWGGGTR